MRLEVVMQLGFCSLCLTLTLLAGGRTQVLPEPPAVNCAWSHWSDWSSCDPCRKTQRRSRSIEVFGQFDGNECQGSLGEVQICIPTDTCFQTPTTCRETEFKCDSGSCISMNLKCNDDLDCEDQSDEAYCEIVNSVCDRILDKVEESKDAGHGINILGGDSRMNPFNNYYFNGRCTKVENANTGEEERLPWNIELFKYETREEETFSGAIYEDANTLLKELLEEIIVNSDAGFSFLLSSRQYSYGGTGAGFQHIRKQTIDDVARYTTIGNKSFMRVKARAQTSTFRMRAHGLFVSDDFLESVKSLPLTYEKAIYFTLLEEYGTHYSKSGIFGGQYNLIYVLNDDVIKEKELTPRDIENCVKTGITISHMRPNWCVTTPTNTGAINGKSVVDKVIVEVLGGNQQATDTMKAKLMTEGVMDLATYKQWKRSFGDLPTQISSEPEPIYNVIPAAIPDANTRISNIKMAIQDYMAEYSVCKCKPCHNGGSIALLNGKCVCLCQPLFEGLACQNFNSDKAAQQGRQKPTVVEEGNWACWSAWSNCSGGKRSRTRGCNTQGLVGASCRGDTTSEEHC